MSGSPSDHTRPQCVHFSIMVQTALTPHISLLHAGGPSCPTSAPTAARLSSQPRDRLPSQALSAPVPLVGGGP